MLSINKATRFDYTPRSSNFTTASVIYSELSRESGKGTVFQPHESKNSDIILTIGRLSILISATGR